MSLKLVMTDGVLAFECPHCKKLLEVGVHVVSASADPERKVSPLTGTHYSHRVEFIAEAPHLHAALWGHMVREHQPLPHPYLSPERVLDMVAERGDQVGVVDGAGDATELTDDGLSMWQQEYEQIQARMREGG